MGGAEGKSDKEIQRQFNRIADKSDETIRKLEDLDAPDDAQDELDALVAAFDRGTKDLRAIADAAAAGDAQKAVAATQKLGADSEKIREAEDKLKEAVDG